jgi:PadR family transcriptional regulator, regulatory protein PadR
MRHGTFEFAVLLVIRQLGEDGYAVTIREALERQTAEPVARGALYTTLARLEDKGLVRSRMGEPLPVRGGKARRFYALTAAGESALQSARARSVLEWRGLDGPLGERP